jgi:hypothetical protein
MSESLSSAERSRAMLRTAMGPTIAAALADAEVIEIMINPDGAYGSIGSARALGYRLPLRARAGRADHPPRREPRAHRGARDLADRLGRAAAARRGGGRAVRGRLAAGFDRALLLDPQAGGADL